MGAYNVHNACWNTTIMVYCIAQIFRWIEISLNAHTLYWHKNFAKFYFAHSAGCLSGNSEWSSRMNTPCLGPNTECTSTVFACIQCV